MNKWNYPGAKWWKFDFHTHSPASTDFVNGNGNNAITPELWLQKFMEKGIDCVAVTDHNSGEWIDKLKRELANLKQNKPDWYRHLYLFPGVEISVQGGVHVLAIFGQDKSQSDIDSLLGAVSYSSTRGNSDDVTTYSATKVVDKITEQSGIAIPAHVGKANGLFQEQNGTTLEQVLDNQNIHAMELCDDSYTLPQLYQDKKLQWTKVRGSDVHDFTNRRFGEFTWVKMDNPSIEGLKLALIDGEVSVNCDMAANPNEHGELVIEELIVDKAKYIGRDEILRCQFSPFLNTIIGGRGSGKSTLLEFMRLLLRRDEEIPESLQPDSNKYFQVGGDNLLIDDSKLSLVYRKDTTRYRLNWSGRADIASLEIDRGDDGWQTTDGEIKSLFPVYIYSQKQIFELARKPQALLGIIDKDPAVDYETIEKQRTELTHRYKQVDNKLRELREKISQAGKLKGQANDLQRQIEQIEKSGHKDVLQNYRQRRQQLSSIEHLENDWQEMADHLIETQKQIAPVNFNEQPFDQHPDILSALQQTNGKYASIQGRLDELTKESQSIIDSWQKEKDTADWMKTLNTEMDKYQQLRTQLEQQGIDPEKYPLLLKQLAQIKKQLEQIESYSSQVKDLRVEQEEILGQIEANRKKLTNNRETFLQNILSDNQSVSIKVKPFGESLDSVEKDIRRILQCEGRFAKDIDNLKTLYRQGAEKVKEKVVKIRSGENKAQDNRFASHLQQSLPQESISDLILWFPEDDLEITFGSGQKIEEGSPGQKTAALLAFILSYGKEPLLLDQPEDDLDNGLIYSLIVKQLREIKSKRQVIIVTHNANIVVNGDAEMVLPLTVANGQSHIENPASIQENAIREYICDILEGGEKAFTQRYKRIHLESR
jgi:energy-coupling factor transporter ATP-binding protein EcfA2